MTKRNFMKRHLDLLTTPPLSRHLAAVWGAYLMEGLLVSPGDPGRAHRILDAWATGSIELITEVCRHVDTLWTQVHSHWEHPSRFPGVFEYEVVSRLGEQLGAYLLAHSGELPADQEIEEMARTLVRSFCLRTPNTTA